MQEPDFSAAMKPKGQTRNPPPPAKLYDLEPIKKKFLLYSHEIDRMVSEAGVHEVKDKKTNEQAVGLGSQAKQLWKKVEDERKRVIADPGEFVKSVNRFAKTYQDRLKTIESGLKKKISDYQYQLELERREAEAKAEKEKQKLQEKLDKEAKKKGVEGVQVESQIVPADDKTTRTEDGSSHQRLHWTFEVVDAKKVPDEYKIPDEKKLRQAVAMGLRDIPGVKIYERSSTVFRS